MSSNHRPIARARSRARADATLSPIAPEDKLAFVEALLSCKEIEQCAQLTVDFVARHLPVDIVICIVPSSDRDASDTLVASASYGIDPRHVGALAVSIEERDHPLVQAFNAPRPAPCMLPRVNGHGGERYLAVPLVVGRQPGASSTGLLLVRPLAKATPELFWLSYMVGHKLEKLRALRTLGDTERTLARERAMLQSVLGAIPDPVLLTDVEGRLLLANPRAELYFASQENESEGRRRAVALNNMLFSAGLSRRVFEGAEEIRRELPLVDPNDGSDRLFELMSAIITTPDGPGVVSVLRNVTDLQLATQEIEENYRRLRVAETDIRAERDRLDLVIDSVADPILVSDPNGAIVLMNTPAERLFTAPQRANTEEMQRVRANDAHFSSHVSNLFFTTSSLRFRGELGLVEPASGHMVPVEAISGKIMSEHGEVTGVVTILHDRSEAIEKAALYEQLKKASDELEQKVRDATTELVRQNELLRRQHIELEQASSLKSQFLANMSHEFRTPLNAILGYTSMLLKGVSGDLQPAQQRSLSRVDSNAKHLLAIINDILDIARIEAGKMPVNLEEFAMPDLVGEVIAEVDPLIPKSRVTVRAEFGSGLPRVKSDRAKLKQILVNLLSNALKFTAAGSVNVATAYAKDTKEIWISVADTGIGIAKKDQELIFADFRQADNSPTRAYGGAGLGLAICRRLAEVLGGQVTLASKVGKGSTFTLVLPVRPRSKR